MNNTLFRSLKDRFKLYLILVIVVTLSGVGLYKYRYDHLVQIKTTEAILLLDDQAAQTATEKHLATISATYLANDITQYTDTQTFRNALQASLPEGEYNNFEYVVKNSTSSMVRIVITTSNDSDTEAFADKLVSFIASKFDLKSTDYTYSKSETTKSYRNIATKEFVLALFAIALLVPALIVWIVGPRKQTDHQ